MAGVPFDYLGRAIAVSDRQPGAWCSSHLACLSSGVPSRSGSAPAHDVLVLCHPVPLSVRFLPACTATLESAELVLGHPVTLSIRFLPASTATLESDEGMLALSIAVFPLDKLGFVLPIGFVPLPQADFRHSPGVLGVLRLMTSGVESPIEAKSL